MGFWQGKRVLVTGHTGFKGSWLSELLLARGGTVYGLALKPDTHPSLFDQLALTERIDHHIADVRDEKAVLRRVAQVRPDVVLHLAAQPLVRRSYEAPVETWATNVMGTVNVLEGVRQLGTSCIVVIVTTDKVYGNREWEHPYRESDALGGHDPYSASKAATELAAASYGKAFFGGGPVRLATARAGNVIGGGDWAEHRILPDIARACVSGGPLEVRNASSLRPWQHVLDPLSGYLALAEALADTGIGPLPDSFNFGPEPADSRTVLDLVTAARRHWPFDWTEKPDLHAPHEAGRLALSIERARSALGWQPRWHFDRAVAETMRWYRSVAEGGSALDVTRDQLAAFESGR